MNFSETPLLKQSRFTEFIIRENSLDAFGFQEWYFYPGMLFNEMDKWWGNGGKREKPHEGVDFCFYKTHQDNVLQLDETIKIPVLYEGVVRKVMDDYIGRSVVIEHRFDKKDFPKFFTIYGHTIPICDLHDGQMVREGEIIATLALPDKPQSKIPPHLHLSVGWTSGKISYDTLGWRIMDKLKGLRWIDPLQIIRRHFF